MNATNTAYDRAITYAKETGETAGANAAGWYVQETFGGRVTRGANESARIILRGIEDGDPIVLDTFPHADLSGEWADTLTGPQLVNDALYAAGLSAEHDASANYGEWFVDICDAYEAAFSDAASAEIERAARATLED